MHLLPQFFFFFFFVENNKIEKQQNHAYIEKKTSTNM
jgi:hypothetical protein